MANDQLKKKKLRPDEQLGSIQNTSNDDFSNPTGSNTPQTPIGGSPESVAYPDDLARRAKALQMLGVSQDSMAQHQQQQQLQNGQDAQEAAQGKAIAEQMGQPDEQDGFETVAQRQDRMAKFNNLKKMMGQ